MVQSTTSVRVIFVERATILELKLGRRMREEGRERRKEFCTLRYFLLIHFGNIFCIGQSN